MTQKISGEVNPLVQEVGTVSQETSSTWEEN